MTVGTCAEAFDVAAESYLRFVVIRDVNVAISAFARIQNIASRNYSSLSIRAPVAQFSDGSFIRQMWLNCQINVVDIPRPRCEEWKRGIGAAS